MRAKERLLKRFSITLYWSFIYAQFNPNNLEANLPLNCSSGSKMMDLIFKTLKKKDDKSRGGYYNDESPITND